METFRCWSKNLPGCDLWKQARPAVQVSSELVMFSRNLRHKAGPPLDGHISDFLQNLSDAMKTQNVDHNLHGLSFNWRRSSLVVFFSFLLGVMVPQAGKAVGDRQERHRLSRPRQTRENERFRWAFHFSFFYINKLLSFCPGIWHCVR